MKWGVGQCYHCGSIETVYRIFGLEYMFCKNCLSKWVRDTFLPIIEIDERKGTCRITKKIIGGR